MAARAGSPLHLLQNELNRLLEDYLQPARYGAAEPPPTDIDPQAWSPAVNVYETNEEMIVVVEVPGVNPASIDLAVTGNVLSIRGAKEPAALPESVPHLREDASARSTASFRFRTSILTRPTRRRTWRLADPTSQAKRCQAAARSRIRPT